MSIPILERLVKRGPEDPAAFRKRAENAFKTHTRLVEGARVRRANPPSITFPSREETPLPNDDTALGAALAYLLPNGVGEGRNGR